MNICIIDNIIFSHIYIVLLLLGLNVLLTCISILAIDFPIFPRKLGKTETFGISLMDVGVGTFIVSSALTSKFARGIQPSTTTATAPTTGTTTFKKLYAIPSLSVQHWLVLLLGIGRLLLLKLLNYQEHVSEYGVHWNFFVTLFCVWTIADCIHYVCSRDTIFYLCIIWILGYQMLLLNTPLTEYMLSPVRDNIISANKEGIISLLGYIPLYLLSEYFANSLIYRTVLLNDVEYAQNHKKQGSINETNMKDCCNSKEVPQVTTPPRQKAMQLWDFPLINRLSLVSIVLWGLWWGFECIQPTSRRLVNTAYIALVLALTTTMILVLYIIDTATTLASASTDSSGSDSNAVAVPVYTLHYMSRHSLSVFLLANAMTGAVNMSMQTVYTPDATALGVLAVYVVAITAVAWGAECIHP